ncbi:hypothetical protein SESBI_36619 [Sesbania bispinosa]|nr:hypothetical protein SESBI_36619 [Sesbania bispinosa]
MKHHLVGTKENVIACTSVPDDVREIFTKLLESREKKKDENSLECFQEVRNEDNGANKGTMDSFVGKGKEGTPKF